MGRRPSVSGGRPVRVSVPLSLAEEALLDGLVAQLGLDRATILRMGLDTLGRQVPVTSASPGTS